MVESLGLSVEFAVGPGGGDHHPGQQIAAFRSGFGHCVVELLADVERLLESDPGRLYSRGERLGLLWAELLDGQLQLVAAGAHRVVDVDDDRTGQVVESVDGH